MKGIYWKPTEKGDVMTVDWKIAHKRNKYGAIRSKYNGLSFASKLELAYYKQLERMQLDGLVSFFLFQVPLHLEGGIRNVVDFVVFHTSGQVEFIDTKGRDTPMSKMKRKQVEARYPIEIKLVTRV
jgi:hypothetical protein